MYSTMSQLILLCELVNFDTQFYGLLILPINFRQRTQMESGVLQGCRWWFSGSFLSCDHQVLVTRCDFSSTAVNDM